MTLFEKYNKFAKKNPYLNGLGILGVVWVLFLTGSSLLGVFHFLYWIGAIGLICSSLLFNKDVVAYYVAGNDTSEILKLVKSFKAPKRPLLSFLFLATLFAFGWHVLLLIYSVALLFLYNDSGLNQTKLIVKVKERYKEVCDSVENKKLLTSKKKIEIAKICVDSITEEMKGK